MSAARVLGPLGDLAPGEARLALARADELDDVVRALGEAVEVTAAARAVSVQGWHGPAADAFTRGVAEVEPSVGGLVRRAGTGAQVLRGWATELTALQQEAQALVVRYRAARAAAEDALDGAAARAGLSVLRTSASERELADGAARARATADVHDEQVRHLEQLGRRLQDQHAAAARRAADDLAAAAGVGTTTVAPPGLLAVVRVLAADTAAATAGVGAAVLSAAGVLALADPSADPALRALRDGSGGPTTVVVGGGSVDRVVVPVALPVLVDQLGADPTWELATTRLETADALGGARR